jgi:LmbE family N-acetylglucosaminyl deacetylase
MNILAIGAHFDDIELGRGGSVARHAAKGDTVTGFVATKSGYQSPDGTIIRGNEMAREEGVTAMEILGARLIEGGLPTFELEFNEALNKQIVRIIEENKIDLIYTHWHGDTHHDHRAVACATLHACRHVPRVLMYRSNWYDGTRAFRGNFYVDITDYWPVKEAAIEAHKDEMTRAGSLWIDYFKREAENAGLRAGVKYAESFEVVKWLE